MTCTVITESIVGIFNLPLVEDGVFYWYISNENINELLNRDD